MACKSKVLGSVVFCLVVLMLLAVWLVPCCFAVDAAEANAAIDQAERDLGSAYVVVAEAEGAGADVSVLLSKLGGAGDILSEAYAALRIGDYAEASALGLNCSSAVEGVAVDAASLKTDANKAHNDKLRAIMTISGIGLVLLIVFGFLGWKLLKRRYFRRILDMKPQVEES